jgi:hypothetical protein
MADRGGDAPVPDAVRQFVVYLYRHIRCVGVAGEVAGLHATMLGRRKRGE